MTTKPNIAESGGEFEFLKRVLGGAKTSKQVSVGPGDDAAVMKIKGQAVVTTDMLIEGEHFKRNWISSDDIGWRSAIASLSDIAAMGAEPVAGFLSLGVPSDLPAEEAEAIVKGVITALENFGAVLAGGDTVASDKVIVNICLIGQTKGRIVGRSGAKPGDLICVTGRIGGARAGMLTLDKIGREEANNHYFSLIKCFRRPTARIQSGAWLNACEQVHAIMDLSDGLSSDIKRICAASNVGAKIDVTKLPYHPEIGPAQPVTGESARQSALIGGEDFELLFALDPKGSDDILMDLLLYGTIQGTVIGRFTEDLDIVVVDEKQQSATVPVGFEHFKI